MTVELLRLLLWMQQNFGKVPGDSWVTLATTVRFNSKMFYKQVLE
jgi:hypothetical protein